MAIYALGDVEPQIHPTAFIHPDAVVIGNVSIGPESSVWPQAVLRGDSNHITVGAQTSIQDGSVIHCTTSRPTVIGSRCVIGHLVHLEGCTIDDDALIGSGSIVLPGAHVHSDALVAAAAMVAQNTIVPAFAMAVGIPAAIKTDRVDREKFALNVAFYRSNAQRYAAELRRLD